MKIIATTLVFGILPAIASAHHSFAAFYELDTIVEVEGEITEVAWRNPHVLFVVRTANSDGEDKLVEVESNSLSVLGRMGVDADLMGVGDHVRVAGQPARRSADQMFATNVLLSDGSEVLFAFDAEPRWETQTLGDQTVWLTDGEGQGVAGQNAGLFRVWVTNIANPESFPLMKEPEGGYPLTESARAAQATWDADEDNPFLGCEPGMPRIMGAITPVEFIEQRDRIEINIELYDARRTVYMNPDEDIDQSLSFLGYSTGHWENETLVVATSGVNWRYFNQSGIPQSTSTEMTERFTPGEDGNRLHYELTINDPETFLEPITFRKYWTWRPGEEVKSYNCTLN